MFGQDFSYIFQWWLLFFVVGVGGLPIASSIFKGFTDIGYGFSKLLSLLFIAYSIFVFSIFKIVPFKEAFLYSFLLIYLSINAYLFFKQKDEFLSRFKSKLRIISAQEIFFTFGLVLWSYVRAHQPDINGLEKFMDFGFINSILRSDYLPPADMWFAGSSINYYWFGHFTTAVLTKLSRIPASITYNLMLATILGLTLTSAFSIISTLIKQLNLNLEKATFYGGVISAIFLTFAGNFHTPVYALKQGVNNYWYPDATRFIGYNPKTNDKTIHEFPIYSFVVSDLHPHLMNLPFVLLFLATLYRFLYLKDDLSKKSKPKANVPLVLKTLQNFFEVAKKYKFTLEVSIFGFLLGIMFMTNTWDFGNYSLLAGVSIFLLNIKKKGLCFESLFETAKKMLFIFFLGIIFASPFIFNFDSIAQGVDFVKARTPLWQLAILWGFPAIMTLFFLAFFARHRKTIKASDLFILSVLITSWILIFLPEIIYVKDIYIASYHRANTMFKLTYQAYVMSYLASGYITIRILTSLKKLSLKVITVVFFSIIFTSILWYPKFAINSYYNNLKTYRGLSGETWLSLKYPDIYNAVLWLRKNVDGQPIILEAPGDSYTDFNVISSYTGLPTVLGWFVHEWLWRGSTEILQKRVNDIQQIYTSANLEMTKTLLKRFNVKYVIIGPFERKKFPNLKSEKFSQIGKEVFTTPTTKIYQVN